MSLPLRQPTTKAIEKAFGGGFLDKINEAEEDAPEMLRGNGGVSED